MTRSHKAIDWKPRKVILTMPPNDQETVVTIDVQPKRGRAVAEVPSGTRVKIVKVVVTEVLK